MNSVELTLDERRIVFQILVHIMNADLKIEPEERTFLDKTFKDFKLSISEFDHGEVEDLDYLGQKFSLFSQEKKKYSKQLFKEMAACDGYIDPREEAIINCL